MRAGETIFLPKETQSEARRRAKSKFYERHKSYDDYLKQSDYSEAIKDLYFNHHYHFVEYDRNFKPIHRTGPNSD